MNYFTFNKSEKENVRLDQIKRFLDQHKLSQYYTVFIEEGFDSILSLFDITETDLIALNVKRGHRRVIQRAIATSRGVPLTTPILINYGYDEPNITHRPKPGTNDHITTTTTTTTTTTITNNSNTSSPKNHKKRKQYIPSKPITAFDEYLNEVKVELDGSSLSEITATAYDRWNLFSPVEKEKYEREALHANSDYVMDKFIYEDNENDKTYDMIDQSPTISRHYYQKSSSSSPRFYYNLTAYNSSSSEN